MHVSSIVIATVRRVPWLFRPFLKVALQFYPYRRDAHWVLIELKEVLGIRTTRRMKVDGFTILADPWDGPGHNFWRTGLTEPETRGLLSALLRPGMVMLDVGAYIGQFSLVASRATGDELRILSIEPTPAVFRDLCRNIDANHCKHVTCVQAALSDAPGSQNFYFFPESQDQNSLRPLAAAEAVSVEVEVKTVDSVAEEYGVDRLDLIKIDVEGNELAVLKGARKSLVRFRPALIIEISRHQSVYGYSGAAIKQLLEGMDYSVHRIEMDHCPPYIPRVDELSPPVSHFNIVAVPADGSRPLPSNRETASGRVPAGS
jgi:FkbM family methyltransferase